jgi:hypothetical protein
MKLFTTILLGALIGLSIGNEVVRTSDTTYIGNTVKVEVQSVTTHADDEAQQKRHHETTEIDRELVAYTKAMNLATWLLAVFAIFGFAFSWRTFFITRKQSKQESRAYVFISIPQEAIKNVYVPAPNESQEAFKQGIKIPTAAYASKSTIGPSVTLHAENYGKTPAYDFVAFADIQVDSLKERPQNLDVDVMISKMALQAQKNGELRSSKAILPPTPHPIQFSASQERTITQAEKVAWEKTEVAIYVFGTVVYRDVFDRYWRADFRYMHTQSSGGPSLGINTSIYTCDDGNKETQIDLKNPPPWWHYYIGQTEKPTLKSRKAPDTSEA